MSATGIFSEVAQIKQKLESLDRNLSDCIEVLKEYATQLAEAKRRAIYVEQGVRVLEQQSSASTAALLALSAWHDSQSTVTLKEKATEVAFAEVKSNFESMFKQVSALVESGQVKEITTHGELIQQNDLVRMNVKYTAGNFSGRELEQVSTPTDSAIKDNVKIGDTVPMGDYQEALVLSVYRQVGE